MSRIVAYARIPAHTAAFILLCAYKLYEIQQFRLIDKNTFISSTKYALAISIWNRLNDILYDPCGELEFVYL